VLFKNSWPGRKATFVVQPICSSRHVYNIDVGWFAARDQTSRIKQQQLLKRKHGNDQSSTEMNNFPRLLSTYIFKVLVGTFHAECFIICLNHFRTVDKQAVVCYQLR